MLTKIGKMSTLILASLLLHSCYDVSENAQFTVRGVVLGDKAEELKGKAVKMCLTATVEWRKYGCEPEFPSEDRTYCKDTYINENGSFIFIENYQIKYDQPTCNGSKFTYRIKNPSITMKLKGESTPFMNIGILGHTFSSPLSFFNKDGLEITADIDIPLSTINDKTGGDLIVTFRL